MFLTNSIRNATKLNKRNPRRKLQRRRNRTHTVEQLESKIYFAGDFASSAATAVLDVDTGTLAINAGSNGSHAEVTFDADTQQVLVEVDNVQNKTAFSRENVRTIYFHGSVSDDIFRNHTDITSVVYGLGGDDLLQGGRSDDHIEGGPGDDLILGNAGNDYLHGGLDTDWIWGESGGDRIIGDVGKDYLFGGANSDALFGGDGDDILHGEGGTDFLFGDGGDDVISLHEGVDRMYGHDGNDRFVGGFSSQIDFVHGGEGAKDHVWDPHNTDSVWSVEFGQGIAEEWTDSYVNSVQIEHEKQLAIDNAIESFWILKHSANLEGGVLTIVADSGGSNVTVTSLSDVEDLHVEIEDRQGTTNSFEFPRDQVTDLVFKGSNEADRFVNRTTIDMFADGEGGNDWIEGGAGDDFLRGGDGSDTIMGHSGSDNLFGGDGDDFLYGLNKVDALEGNGNDDSVIDGQGGEDGLNVILGGAGNDKIYGAGSRDFLFGDGAYLEGEMVVNSAAGGSDEIYGGSGEDQIHGGPQHDIIRGGDDNDKIWGEAGSDRLLGDGGNDALYGGDGRDSIYGGDGDDAVRGEGGADFLFGDGNSVDNVASDLPGNDEIHGGAGEDRILGGPGDDFVSGGGDADKIWGEAGSDRLLGDGGNDALYGGGGRDSIYGGDGDDAVRGEGGADFLFGDGNSVDNVASDLPGNDEIHGGAGEDRILGGPGDDFVSGGGDADKIWGEGGSDRLLGDDGWDFIWGGKGNDDLYGGGGNDVLRGGSESDEIVSGEGADTIYGDDGFDLLADPMEEDWVFYPGGERISGGELLNGPHQPALALNSGGRTVSSAQGTCLTNTEGEDDGGDGEDDKVVQPSCVSGTLLVDIGGVPINYDPRVVAVLGEGDDQPMHMSDVVQLNGDEGWCVVAAELGSLTRSSFNLADGIEYAGYKDGAFRYNVRLFDVGLNDRNIVTSVHQTPDWVNVSYVDESWIDPQYLPFSGNDPNEKGRENWAMLYQKAFTQNPKFENTNVLSAKGAVYSALTGGVVGYVDLGPTLQSAELIGQIQSHVAVGHVVVVGSPDNIDYGNIVPSHAYSVVEIEGVGLDSVVTLRNPYGDTTRIEYPDAEEYTTLNWIDFVTNFDLPGYSVEMIIGV